MKVMMTAGAWHDKPMKRKFALFLLISFSLALLGLAFHHHTDGTSHEDCSLCFQVSHHASAAFQDVTRISAPVPAMLLVFPADGGQTLAFLLLLRYSNRAPPASQSISQTDLI